MNTEYSSNSKSFLYLLLLFLFSSCKTYLLSQKKFIAIEYHDVNNRNSFSYEKQKGPISFSRSNPKWKQRQSDNRNILTRFITSPSFINSPFHCLLSLDYDNPIITYGSYKYYNMLRKVPYYHVFFKSINSYL